MAVTSYLIKTMNVLEENFNRLEIKTVLHPHSDSEIVYQTKSHDILEQHSIAVLPEINPFVTQ